MSKETVVGYTWRALTLRSVVFNAATAADSVRAWVRTDRPQEFEFVYNAYTRRLVYAATFTTADC